jgi:hypothetical protein
VSRSQSKAEYGRFAHLFVGGIEWLLSQWQALTGGEETDLHSHAASGGGLPLLIFASTHGGVLSDTDPHDFVLDPATASVAVGAWTLNGDNDLVVPVAGWYEVIFSAQLNRTAGAESVVRMDLNSATSDTDAGPVIVAVAASADSSVVDQDARSYTTYTAGQSTGKLQLTQLVAAAASASTSATARVAIRCLALT